MVVQKRKRCGALDLIRTFLDAEVAGFEGENVHGVFESWSTYLFDMTEDEWLLLGFLW